VAQLGSRNWLSPLYGKLQFGIAGKVGVADGGLRAAGKSKCS